jgi:hypothetical protein
VAPTRYEFDAVALFEALNRRRQERGLSSAQVGAEVGVGPSTLTRTRRGLRMEADGMRAMVRWLGRAPEDFMVGPKRLAGPVPQAVSASGRRRRVDTVALQTPRSMLEGLQKAGPGRILVRNWGWRRAC